MLKPSDLSRNIFYKKLSAEILIIFEFWLDRFLKVPEVLDGFLFKIQKFNEGCFVFFEQNVG